MRRISLVCLVVLGIAYAVGVPLFLLPDDDPLPRGADAVVALSGPGNLLETGRELVDSRGLAPTLVVSASRRGREDRVRFCRSAPAGVECVYPGPLYTRGEALAISRFVEAQGWDSIVLVASDYERYVTERAFRRCGDFRVAVHGVDQPWWREVVGIPLEWVKLAITETVRRLDC